MEEAVHWYPTGLSAHAFLASLETGAKTGHVHLTRVSMEEPALSWLVQRHVHVHPALLGPAVAIRRVHLTPVLMEALVLSWGVGLRVDVQLDLLDPSVEMVRASDSRA